MILRRLTQTGADVIVAARFVTTIKLVEDAGPIGWWGIGGREAQNVIVCGPTSNAV